ncbi:aminoacyl-tRNA hydrolase [Kordiimonas sp. SCSIO 12603]|uniref:aminoacyl-tRNA hydrolase n=1 Tax=Kordiimonas sp. SCSIO 12603 TaxID=2829596 RepID=UPI00210358C0|nr:aminoacyl-tRNA hydrolase [Kordiimonas sp. SCSIO 12603]UTW60107.1 aminoacyl-tRNA hydrolase [Kordiimonas sp. SCSIO 12603]
MLLFVGLGNPGSKYENNRHNVGFMAVDEIVRRHNFLPEKKRWQALTHEGTIAGEKIIIIKPQTYMNESGRSVGEAMRFYKLAPKDVVVFYDELDLAFAKTKVKIGGGAAGHNGIRSITSHIGADFTRIRIGIGHPGDKARVHGHVLGDFAKAEQPTLDKLLDAIASECDQLAKGDNPRFMSEVARTMAPPRPSTGNKKPAEKTAEETTNKKPVARTISARPALKQNSSDGPMADALRALKSGDK